MAPYTFPLVKSKCYSDEGEKTCSKQGHSCFRRVINSSCIPYKRGWRLMARGARAVLRQVELGCEVFDITTVGALLRHQWSTIHPRVCSCWQCQDPLTQTTIITADIDQAFENVKGSEVGAAWDV
eukprot:10286150-Karenia_brevis.AAC.1